MRISAMVLVAVGAVLGAWGCRTGGGGKDAGDGGSAVLAIDAALKLAPSDVTFLLPKDHGAQDQLGLKVSETGDKGQILTEANFGQLPIFVDRGHPGIVDPYKKLFITSVRFDPCAPQVAPDASPASCKSLLRLVAQLFENGRPTDAGIHLIYELDAAETTKVVEELQGLKRDSPVPTDDAPIGVHPGFAGLTSGDPQAVAASTAFFGKVKAFILKHAGKKNYFATSVMVTLDKQFTADKPQGSITWEWAIGIITLGRVVRLPVTGVSGLHLAQQFTATGRNGTVDPPSKVKPEMAAILSANPPDPQANPDAYNAALHMENPALITVPGGDCVSCHLATPGRVVAENKFGAPITGTDLFTSPSGVTSPMGDDVRTLMGQQIYVVLNFAYFFGKPSVSQRTINETLEVVRFVNTNLIH